LSIKPVVSMKPTHVNAIVIMTSSVDQPSRDFFPSRKDSDVAREIAGGVGREGVERMFDSGTASYENS